MKSSTSVNSIASYLRHEITYNHLKSGQHLKEASIAKMFGVSRVPVREAFRILQSEGYIDVIHNRGVFVKKISQEYIHQVAMVYELLAPRLLKSAIPKYKESTFIKAYSILNKIEKCKNFEEVGYLIRDFAVVIYSISKMKFVLSIIDSLYRHNIRWLSEIFEISGTQTYDISTHRKFLEYCKQKKTGEAIELWSNHVEKIKRILTNLHK